MKKRSSVLSVLIPLIVIASALGQTGAESISQPASSMETVVGKVADTGYHLRYSAARELGSHLSAGEIEMALVFLKTNPDDDPLPASALNAIKNDLVLALIKQETPIDELGETLMRHFHNESMDDGWRDYCLQLLRAWYETAREEQRERIARFYLEVVDSREATFSGTALISMRALAGQFEVFTSNDLVAIAHRIAADPEQPGVNRAAALQVGADLGGPELLEIARSLGYDDRQDVFLRSAAIAAIGGLGNHNDRIEIESLAESMDTRLRTAAVQALSSLE